MRIFFCVLAIILCASGPASATKVSSSKKIITGWLENIYIPSIESRMRAKLDTGAKTSSIDAEIIEVRKTDDENEKLGRIIFTVEDSEGAKKTLERKIVRWVRIKKKSNVSGYVRRPVVLMEYCIAGKLIEDEVNLANREHFNYPVLIGRNMLTQAGLVVDTSKIFTRKPNCKEKNGEEAETIEKPVKKKPRLKAIETPKQEEERLEHEMKSEQPKEEEIKKSGLKGLGGEEDEEDDEEDENIESEETKGVN